MSIILRHEFGEFQWEPMEGPDPAITAAIMAAVMLYLGPWKPDHISCEDIYEGVVLLLPPSLVMLDISDIYAKFNLDVSMTQLQNLYIENIRIRDQWITGLSWISQIPSMGFIDISAGGIAFLGAMPALSRARFWGIHAFVSIGGGGDKVAQISIENVMEPLCISRMGPELQDLHFISVSGDYDLSGLPAALRRITLTNLRGFDLMRIELPPDLQTLYVVSEGAEIRANGIRGNPRTGSAWTWSCRDA